MKTCTKCNTPKPPSAFYFDKTKGKYRSDCRECHKVIMRPRSRRHYRANKTYYVERNRKARQALSLLLRQLKHNQKCADCGNPHPYWRLDYHHLRDKKFDVGRMLARGKKKLLEEIKKCVLICANCHRDRTYASRARQDLNLQPVSSLS